VFDPCRLLGVRVGNLNKLRKKIRVFDPGHLLGVRVGNLNEYESKNVEKLYSEEPFILFIE